MGEKNIIKQRNINIDLTKCIATVCVICVHFFLNIEYYSEIMSGKRMILMTFIRTLSMICVPLFLVLTGYLMRNKKLSAKYYKGILHTILIYIIMSLFCIIYKCTIGWEMSVEEVINSILNYSAAPYAWYVEMYIGLFIIIPFLNVLYQNLETKKNKEVLLLSLCSLIVLPTICNLNNTKYVPAFWVGIWPVLYYFVGSYIGEYRPKISSRLNFFLIIVVLMFNTGFIYMRCSGGYFEWNVYNDWYGWQNFLSTVLVFIFVQNIDLSRLPRIICSIVSYIAKLSLGIYLASWIMDNWYYSYLLEKVPVLIMRLEYFPISVCIVFCGSLLLASLGELLLQCLSWGFTRIYTCVIHNKRKQNEFSE